MTAHRHLALLLLAATVACGSSSNTPCDPVAQAGCESGLVCAPVVGGQAACFPPVRVSGRVFDLADGTGLASASVVALDVDGAPATRIGVSAAGPDPASGTYSLSLPVPRAASGAPAASITLRADRQGYAAFPSGLRTALPIDLSSAVLTNGTYVVASSQTDIGLSALASAPAGQIAGTVALPASGAGALLVAEETTSHAGLTALPGRDGAFTVFNVPDGTYEVRAYAKGVNYAPVTVVVSGGVAAPTSATLAPSATPTATVSGSIQLVSSTAWDRTSVLLVVASTFDPARVRGAAPPGLKASGIASTWSIAGIPDGHYRVLAAFETDYLVRDPSDIGGTAVLEFQVVNGLPRLMDGTTSAATLAGFKITGAVRLTAPLRAADGSCTTVAAGSLPADPAGLLAGTCATPSATPAFGWESYSATDHYRVTVVDEQGAVTWQADVGKGSPATSYGAAVGAAGVEATIVAPQALVAGRTYQVKVTSVPVGGVPLSYSEDLLGVFTYAPPP